MISGALAASWPDWGKSLFYIQKKLQQTIQVSPGTFFFPLVENFEW